MLWPNTHNRIHAQVAAFLQRGVQLGLLTMNETNGKNATINVFFGHK